MLILDSDLPAHRRRQINHHLPVRSYKPFFMEVYLAISRAWKFTRQTVHNHNTQNINLHINHFKTRLCSTFKIFSKSM